MTLKRIIPIALALTTALPVFSQVQLFEAEVSGIIPYVAGKWNQGIQEYVVGLEYNIDGRTSLGVSYAKPLKDTLTFDPALKAYTVNPYAVFEFIEPDNLKTFSFAIRADFINEDSNKPKTNDGTNLNSFSRTSIGGGPIFALRIFSSDKLVMIPTAAYEFFYVTYKRDDLSVAGTTGKFPEGTNLWHDLTGSCPFHFILNEFNGISLEPKVTVKFGPGHAAKDLLNVSATVGYIRAF
jgi:hypothetical protein